MNIKNIKKRRFFLGNNQYFLMYSPIVIPSIKKSGTAKKAIIFRS